MILAAGTRSQPSGVNLSMRNSLQKYLLIAIVLVVAGALVALSRRQSSTVSSVPGAAGVPATSDAGPYTLLTGKDVAPAADFTLTDLSGSTVTLSQAVKKGPVVLDFWATWCGPCMMAMPDLEKIQANYQNKGVQFLAINSDEGAADLKNFVQQNHSKMHVIVDSDGSVHQTYGIRAIPVTIVVDRNLKVRSFCEGYDPNMLRDLPVVLDQVLRS